MLVKIDATGANIVPDGASRVRVVFELVPAGSGMEGVFECLPCGDLLVWLGSKNRWVCPGCAYELHPVEAQFAIKIAHVLLDRLSETVTPVKDKKPWAWVTWLLRLLRIKTV